MLSTVLLQNERVKPGNVMGDYNFVQIFVSNASSCNRFNYGYRQLLGKLLPISGKRTPRIIQEYGKARGTDRQ